MDKHPARKEANGPWDGISIGHSTCRVVWYSPVITKNKKLKRALYPRYKTALMKLPKLKFLIQNISAWIKT